MNYYSVELPVKKLLYGVNRNKEWWEKYPRRIKMLNKLTESIEKEGLKNPLFVSETDKGYVVEVGNQRLQALNNLNYKKVKCILYSKKNYLNYEKLKPEQCVLPDDVDLWDADIQFKEE